MAFHDALRQKMDSYVHLAYKLTRQFPKEEMYGAGSQFRRAALSVILNYIEGYARQREKVLKNFLQISYGSLHESRYLLKFALDERWIPMEETGQAMAMADEIGAMLWSTIDSLKDASSSAT
jgi:four helix bundle protein